MNRERVKAIVMLVVVFAAGAASGIAGTRLVAARKMTHLAEAGSEATRRDLLLRVLDRKLSLTAEQRTQAERILALRGPEAEQVLSESEPRLREIRKTTYAEIRVLLTSDQQHEFDRLVERFESRRRRRF
ncbi:MAG: hypothetical protein WCI05_09150 [Myxococcales bacterium]